MKLKGKFNYSTGECRTELSEVGENMNTVLKSTVQYLLKLEGKYNYCKGEFSTELSEVGE